MHHPITTATLVASLALAPALAAADTFIIPTSAVAGSAFNSLYDIGNTIDGSGLPASFTLADAHANYAVDNHWTTQAGAIGAGTAWAEFFFSTPQTLGQFHLWNHRSNIIASNSNYAVTQFDLQLRDSSGAPLLTLNDVQAAGVPGDAYNGGVQTFEFAATEGVASVWFRIDRNVQIDLFGGDGVYTGVAEVAFGSPVPEPETLALMLLGLGAIGARMQRRRAG